MRLAIIPARGGSKRIPRKNIRQFAGQPIISWSISVARQSGCFDRIIVSTDDPEISEVAKAHGAEVPFVRPLELSDDHTPTIPVIAHAIAWQNANGEEVTEACCIYATAPFIRAEDLQRGLEAIQGTDAKYAFSVTSYAAPIQRALRITPTKRIAMFQSEHFLTRSQDLEEAWHDAAQFYWGKADAWLTELPLFSEAARPIILPRHLVQDIDTPDDWVRAEMMFKCLNF
jgi:pseudaminic acid cytidylyltransferase